MTTRKRTGGKAAPEKMPEEKGQPSAAPPQTQETVTDPMWWYRPNPSRPYAWMCTVHHPQLPGYLAPFRVRTATGVMTPLLVLAIENEAAKAFNLANSQFRVALMGYQMLLDGPSEPTGQKMN